MPPIYVGGAEVNELYVGGTEVQEVYVGSQLVYKKLEPFITTEIRTNWSGSGWGTQSAAIGTPVGSYLSNETFEYNGSIYSCRGAFRFGSFLRIWMQKDGAPMPREDMIDLEWNESGYKWVFSALSNPFDQAGCRVFEIGGTGVPTDVLPWGYVSDQKMKFQMA